MMQTADTVQPRCVRDGRAAPATCARCGDALCSACALDVNGLSACSRCAETVSRQHPPTGLRLHSAWRSPQVVAWILWSGFVFAYLSYFLTAYFVLRAADEPPSSNSVAVMAAILAVVALVQGASSYLLWTRLPRWLAGRGVLKRSALGGLITLVVWFVCAVIVHGAGIYGLVLFFMVHGVHWLLLFMLPSLLGMLALAPRWNHWFAHARAAEWTVT